MAIKKQVRFLVFATLAGFAACTALAQQPNSSSGTSAAARPKADPEAAARTASMAAGDTSPAAMEVIAFEKSMEAAVVRGDVSAVRDMLADDFVMVHGDGWIAGGKPLLEDNKESFLKRVENKQYLAREISTVKAEMHGDTAVLYGQYVSENSPGGTPRSWFSVWYERVYAKRNGKWMFLSHRTVHGPTYGPDRDSVANK
jgi:ketosteroid isomerase-like protein